MENDRNRLLATVADSLEEQIAVVDRHGRIVEVNAAWIHFGAENGLAPDYRFIGSNYLDVLKDAAVCGDKLAAAAAAGLSETLSGQRPSFYLEYPCHSPTRKRWFMMRAIALKDGTGNHFVVTHHDITERKLAEEEAAYLSLHDSLTKLANRRHFNQALNREMRRCIRSRSPITLMLVDLDYFKDYNDEHGHPAGDRCLVRIGKALSAAAKRPGDLAARLGGDEFALILAGTDLDGARNVAETVRRKIERLDMRFGRTQRITASIGAISLTPEKGQSGNDLFEATDKVLYRAKAAGRNRAEHVRADGGDALQGSGP